MSGPTTGSGDGPARDVVVRWGVLGLLLVLMIGALGAAAIVVMKEGAGSNPVRKLDSLISPASNPSGEREQALAVAKEFVERFNTYGPAMLDDGDKMPEYAAVADMMTAKFAAVFEANVGYAEQTVAQTQIDRIGAVQGIGISNLDEDSALALAAGTVQFSYPDPKDPSERVDFAPVRFRYEVSLVKQDGRWRIDDLDDIDDELPSFADASDAQTGTPGGQPAPTPGQGASDGPTDSPSDRSSDGGGR